MPQTIDSLLELEWRFRKSRYHGDFCYDVHVRLCTRGVLLKSVSCAIDSLPQCYGYSATSGDINADYKLDVSVTFLPFKPVNIIILCLLCAVLEQLMSLQTINIYVNFSPC